MLELQEKIFFELSEIVGTNPFQNLEILVQQFERAISLKLNHCIWLV